MAGNSTIESLSVRAMTHEDVEHVIAIERQGYSFPWSEAIFHDCLRVKYHCLVLLSDDQIVGYSIVHFVLDESHILNICVKPDQQNQGFGYYLMQHIIHIAKAIPCQKLFLEVRSSHKPAVHLYKKLHFKQIGVRKGYYPAGKQREDAIVMALSLS